MRADERSKDDANNAGVPLGIAASRTVQSYALRLYSRTVGPSRR
jgi:hypothetical protein